MRNGEIGGSPKKQGEGPEVAEDRTPPQLANKPKNLHTKVTFSETSTSEF